MSLESTDQENRKEKSIQTVRLLISDLSWKFHENPFSHFSVTLLAARISPKIEKEIMYARGWIEHLQNFQIVPCTKSDLSCNFHENPFTRFP